MKTYTIEKTYVGIICETYEISAKSYAEAVNIMLTYSVPAMKEREIIDIFEETIAIDTRHVSENEQKSHLKVVDIKEGEAK